MGSNARLNRAYKNALRLTFNSESKFILFSDCHRGDTSVADDFADNRNIYYHAMKHYFDNDFHYIELGDGDELWENISFKSIFHAHRNVYLLLKKFYDHNRLHFIWGNHDMVYKSDDYVKKTLYTYFDRIEGKETDLFRGIKVHEAIVLNEENTGQKILLLHGHQADWWNYLFWKWSRFLVLVLWKPLNVMGIADPTSPAKNYRELIKIERRIKKWIVANNYLITIAGHTHRPRFPEPNEIPFFNDGSCVHPRSITGLEIENGKIALIKWHVETDKNGYLQIVRVLLEGPQKLSNYAKT